MTALTGDPLLLFLAILLPVATVAALVGYMIGRGLKGGDAHNGSGKSGRFDV